MMSRCTRTLPIALVVLGMLLVAPEAEGQSILSSRGLGYPMQPLDARARGLGGVALGFPEPGLSWANPAEALGLAVPGLLVAYQHDNFDSRVAGEETDGRSARFPLLLAAFPISEKFVILGGYGAVLDQNWQIERPDTLRLSQDTIAIVDRITSSGGPARLRAGAAYALTEAIGIGAALDMYTGSLQRTQSRFLQLSDVVPATVLAGWNFHGFGMIASAQWTPSTALAIAGSITTGGRLEAEVEEGEVDEFTFDLPLLAQLGASGRIGPATLLALGASWSGWSSLDEALRDVGGARDTWSAHAGVEWEGIIFRDRPIPLRFGARTAALPFRWHADAGSGDIQERALTSGLGAVLAGGAVHTDLGLELGTRSDDADRFDESFWRFSLSVRVLGR